MAVSVVGTLALAAVVASPAVAFAAPAQNAAAHRAAAQPVAPATASPTPVIPNDTLDASKPYMGWSSYSMQVYSGSGSTWPAENDVRAQSDAMHKTLQAYGYNRINVDAGWNDGVDAYGRPKPSGKLYPGGFTKLIDYVHANGQKFGVYMIPGISPEVYKAALPIYDAPGCTTADIVTQPLQQADYWGIGYRLDFADPCAKKYVDSVADQLKAWGVDFLKFDSVTPGSGVSDLTLDARDDVAAWSEALHRNNIWFEISWAVDIAYADLWQKYADGWRVDWDVECYCAGKALTTWDNISRLFPRLADWWVKAGPKTGWNDLDSLDIGNGRRDGLTLDERRTAMTLWATSAAPLSLGDDLTDLDADGISLLTNKDVIAINQQGHPARPVSTSGQQQAWYSLNDDGSYTVALYNLGRANADVSVSWSDIGLTGAGTVRDVWAGKKLGSYQSGFTAANVPLHGVRLLQVVPDKSAQVAVDDDDTRISATGDWARNGGKERSAVSQALPVAIGDSATDAAPKAPDAHLVQTINNNDPGLVYAGSWNYNAGRNLGDYQDDVQWSEHDGDSVSYTFVGTGIDYATELDSGNGRVDVYLDGAYVTTVDTWRDPSQPREAQQIAYSSGALADGTHTLKLVKKSGSYMIVDRFDITRSSLMDPASAAFDKAAPADLSIALNRAGSDLVSISDAAGGLVRGTDYAVSGDTVTLATSYLMRQAKGTVDLQFSFRGDAFAGIHYTKTDGDALELGFVGTGVQWVAPLAPDQGTAKIYLDGALVDTVDAHAAERSSQNVLFSADKLKNGAHTIRIVKASGDLLRSDLIRYTVK